MLLRADPIVFRHFPLSANYVALSTPMLAMLKA
ncbi:MAG: hypothetical protein K0S84_832 [Nitrososphaera sp.]|jgi:hypothetical protein|nr:hypothetical protein [Nitrososphaera sp.]